MASIKTSTRQVDGVAIVDLSGRITLGEASVAVRDIINDLMGNGHKKIVLNLAEVNYVDSSGVGVLVSSISSVRKQGGELKLAGTLWVDDKQQRLEEITGRLVREVKFGGGLLGHLDQGGTFEVKQAPVAPGYWELTLLNVHMKGKALFFKTISVQQNYSRSNFKRVPDDLTLANAAKMLEQGAVAHNQAKTSR